MTSKPRREVTVADLQERLKIYEAVHAANERYPEVAQLAFEATSSEDLIAKLRNLLGLDEMQAIAVTDQQLRRVPRPERRKVAQEIAELKAAIEDQLRL